MLIMRCSTVTIQNSTISGNSSGYGGGIYASGGTFTVQNSTISENSAEYGGGIYATSATVTITRNTFTNNSASSGGAIYASGTVIMQGNTITQNTASTSFRGVVRLDVSADSIIGGDSCEYANVIKDNTGDGVYIKGNPAFNHNDVYNNTGFSLVCGNASGAAPIDATNCYWGTDKESVVKAMIWDGLDDASLGLVNYNPFLTVPCKPDDIIPPAAVTDLAASDLTANSITLTWTVPGDDGDEGQAKTYDIRYSTSEITDANWDEATQCEGEPPPKPAGEP
ncbi:TPA: hypothetical protein EYP66_15445, partial [Candidatus Poribacteria bacterium]|nr:hypothetical protein [Candidatus Poribacteria bacterium]